MTEILTRKRTRAEEKKETKKQIITVAFPHLLESIEKINDAISEVPHAYYLNRQNYGEKRTHNYLDYFRTFLFVCDDTRKQIEVILPKLSGKEKRKMQQLYDLLDAKRYGSLNQNSYLLEYYIKENNVVLILQDDINPSIRLGVLKAYIPQRFMYPAEQRRLKFLCVELMQQVTEKGNFIYRSVQEIYTSYQNAEKQTRFARFFKNFLPLPLN